MFISKYRSSKKYSPFVLTIRKDELGFTIGHTLNKRILLVSFVIIDGSKCFVIAVDINLVMSIRSDGDWHTTQSEISKKTNTSNLVENRFLT